MSMNLYIYGKREIMVVKTGKYEFQTKKVEDILPTSTTGTNKILKSSNPMQSYYDFIKEFAYGDDYNIKKHISNVKNNIKEMENNGYKIYFDEF